MCSELQQFHGRLQPIPLFRIIIAMSITGSMEPAPWTAEQENILRTVLYFDLFRHPLSLGELERFLPSPVSGELRSVIEHGPLASVLILDKGYVRIAVRSKTIIEEREHKERRARKLWRIARFLGIALRHIPYVRCVCVSGELSKGVASSSSDIDLFVITAGGRIWVTRAILTAIKKVLFLNSKRYFCLNHFIDEDHLTFGDRNIYTALEIVTLRPLFGEKLYRKYLQANDWTREYVPNAIQDAHLTPPRRDSQSYVQRCMEALFPAALVDRWDMQLFEFWTRLWRRRYPELSPEALRHQFQSSRFISTAYGQDMLARVMARYQELLIEFRCAPPEKPSGGISRTASAAAGLWPTYS